MVSSKGLAAALSHINDGLVIAECSHTGHCVTLANDALERITGYNLADLQQQGLDLLCRADGSEEALLQLRRALSKREACQLRLRGERKNGQPFWCELKLAFTPCPQSASHLILVCRDIAQEEHMKDVLDKVSLLYREMSKRLEYSTEVDTLTQLKSRNHLTTRGEFVLGAAKRQKLRLHTIVIDIDNFKQLNALGGNAFGDECLIAVAELINQYFCRATDISIRMCDDEFVVLCLDDEDCRVLERAQHFRRQLQSLALRDTKCRQHQVRVRVGIYSTTPDKYTTVEELVEKASQLVSQPLGDHNDHVAHSKGNDARTIKP